MKKKTDIGIYHGKDLDKLISKAYSELSDEFCEGDIKIDTQFLNDEWVVTMTATCERNFHYEIIWEQNVGDDPEPAIYKLNKYFDKHKDIEVIKIVDNDGLHIDCSNTGDFSGDMEDGFAGSFESTSTDYESAYALIKVYEED